ncbi:MAG: Gfo/Idh/MocA family oxidoreductase [Gammaproteobacteria bacterium]|jgi:predicted dehydrogenase|nr:Gfo/Idh/MocA family oxidoreductase [Gammaproteobacteria bacterium]
MKINIALLGTGLAADELIAPALKLTRHAQLWSVLSRDRSKALDLATRHGAASTQAAYESLDALLSDPELDAVYVASPDGLHATQVIAAAQAGKHIICEKPIATSVDDAKAMVNASNTANVVMAIAYHLRWHSGHRKLAELISSGGLGTIRHMRVHWSFGLDNDHNWRASDNVGRWWSLGSTGTHNLDLIRWMLLPSCGEVEEIKSTITRSIWNGPHDETAIVSMRFESGATAEFCSSVQFDSPARVEIYGTDGYGICDNTLGPDGDGTIITHKGELKFEVSNPYVGEIDDFTHAIVKNREPEVGGIEAIRNIELLSSITKN